jgi:hypothetical protein
MLSNSVSVSKTQNEVDMGNPRPPTELKTAGKALWRAIWAGFSTDDPRETHAIRQACRLEDDITRLRAELADAHTIVKGSTGQPVESPLLGSVRNATALQAKLLASLAIENGASNAAERSAAGRKLVAMRRDRAS